MNRFDERIRGVKLQVLDLSGLEARALEHRQMTHPDCYEVKIHGGEVALHKSSNGHLYSICTEGVGYVISDSEPLELNFHGSYYARDEDGEINPSSHSFDILPFVSAELYPDDLKCYPVKEEVDLADFIRSFGARLENNFWTWFKELS